MNLLIAFGIAVFPIFIVAASLQFWHWYRSRKQLRSPLTRALLRSPGESLRHQIDDMTWDIASWAAALSLFPSTLYAIYLSQAHLFESSLSAWIFATTGAIVFFYAMYRLIRTAALRRRLRQGFDGEMAVGQELTELLKDGMSVFHDIEEGRFNIDHVIVGPNGVYAVETKTRAKRRTGRGKYDANVKVEGDKLLFPSWTETKWTEQARRQARWLSQWLTGVIGEKVEVKPMLALPGWFIEIVKPCDVLVTNARNPRLLMQKIKGAPLTDEQVRRITQALEQRCRDVEAQEM